MLPLEGDGGTLGVVLVITAGRAIGGARNDRGELGGLAELGFDAAMGAVANVWDVTPVEMIGAEVIPVVADL